MPFGEGGNHSICPIDGAEGRGAPDAGRGAARPTRDRQALPGQCEDGATRVTEAKDLPS